MTDFDKRNIMLAILSYITVSLAFTFFTTDKIPEILEMIIWGIVYLVVQHDSFRHGVQTHKEISEKLNQ